MIFLAIAHDAQLLILLWWHLIDEDRRHRAVVGIRNRRKLDILCEQQNHRCCYCGVRFADAPEDANIKKRRWRAGLDGHPDMATVEHVIRIVDGGLPTWENEVAACARCNTTRDAVDAYSFYRDRLAILANRKRRRRQKKRADAERRGFYYQNGKRVYLPGRGPGGTSAWGRAHLGHLAYDRMVGLRGIEPRTFSV